jgi:hypothetical protein
MNRIFYLYFKLVVESGIVLYAFIVGFAYIAIAFIPALIIPPLKKAISEYFRHGTTKPMYIIAGFSGTLIFILICILTRNAPDPFFGPVRIIFWYGGFIYLGYFALYLLHGYCKKLKIKRGST